MERSLRIRPRLSRTMPSMTKEATSFVCAASCNNNAASLTNSHFPLPVLTPRLLVIRRFYTRSLYSSLRAFGS